MDADLDTLATALSVATDDLLKENPERPPARPAVGIAPRISDAELLTLAVMQAVQGHTSETRWLRPARTHLLGIFPRLPQQSGYNKRLRRLSPKHGPATGRGSAPSESIRSMTRTRTRTTASSPRRRPCSGELGTNGRTFVRHSAACWATSGQAGCHR